ncbi:MAG: hypothetical protein HZC28_06650 [Spirochaetes bacterium]|nr:hypothetical protein [Spirochaetota bacterium]
MKNIIALTCCCIALSAQIPLSVTVDESVIIKKADNKLIGHNLEWTAMYLNPSNGVLIPGTTELHPDVMKLLLGIPLPVSRISGTTSQEIHWKKAVGPLADRAEQKLADWERGGIKRAFGPVEWVRFSRTMDPSVQLVWCINMFESPEDAADLAEFFTGDGTSNPNGGENWAAKRIAYGLSEPVTNMIWELGNELDGIEYYKKWPSPKKYTDACKAVIAAVRTADPKARFAAFAATLSTLSQYKQIYGGTWDIWHKAVLREFGGDIDYVVFHPYYGSAPSVYMSIHERRYLDTIRNDIKAVTGSDRIKIFLSEYAFWPEQEDPDKPWQQSWYRTHSLEGCLADAEWINRMVSRPDVTLGSRHCLGGSSAGPWALIYFDRGAQKHYLTGIAEIFTMFNVPLTANGNVVQCVAEGEKADLSKKKCLVTASAVTVPQGLALLIVNRDPENARALSFAAKQEYRLVSETLFTSDSVDDVNSATAQPLVKKTKAVSDKGTFASYVIPAKSFIILTLARK